MDRTKLLITLALLLVSPRVVALEGRTVEVKSEDGFALAATLWQNADEGPGILLLHQCDGDRSMYAGLGPQLAAAGFRVLAPDFRGLGESTSEQFDLTKSGTPEDWERAKEMFGVDVVAARRYLGNVVGALGASCGGGEVIRLAKAHPDLKAVGLLSARLSALEERDAMQLSSQVLLLIAAKADGGAVRPAGTLAYRRREAATLKLFEGDAHGYALFAQEPELVGTIVAWFKQRTEAAEE